MGHIQQGLSRRNKTLGEMMTELRARLGFVTQGSASKGNEVVLKSFCQEAQEYVYGALELSDMRMRSVISMQPGESLYDWHDDELDLDIDPLQVKYVYLRDGSFGQQLNQGISEKDRAFSENRFRPERYDTLNGQMEVYPVPDREYLLVVEHTCMPGRFEQNADRPNAPYRLVFLYALANAKAHYRHPDAQTAAITFQNMLKTYQDKQKENRRYFARGAYAREAQVTRSGDGYVLKG